MSNARLIDTAGFSTALRARAVETASRRLLITDFRGTDQETDLTLPPNCGGYGRIRHFRRGTSPGWPPNPLPLDPAVNALGLPRMDEIEAQVFQNAACNWRCWYCYVPFDLLAANPSRSAWLSADDLIDSYLAEPSPPRIIDLTGGQPDLVPEWIPWMMKALKDRGMDRSVYLWSDDNLSADYYFRFLSPQLRAEIAAYGNYGRVCCFKGYDPASFSFNTLAAPELFERQFQLFDQLLGEHIDLYAYVTFTSVDASRIEDGVSRFIDRLQAIHPNLPLRTVPLEILRYTPMQDRLKPEHREAMRNQWVACEVWQRELESRFSNDARSSAINDVPMLRGS